MSYPTREEVETDTEAETEAINLCKEAMVNAMADAPLEDSQKVYAAIELALDLCGLDYARDVFNEVCAHRLIWSTPTSGTPQ